VRIASSALLARALLKGNMLLADSALEAMRTQRISTAPQILDGHTEA
jgi:hypothetical protein